MNQRHIPGAQPLVQPKIIINEADIQQIKNPLSMLVHSGEQGPVNCPPFILTVQINPGKT